MPPWLINKKELTPPHPQASVVQPGGGDTLARGSGAGGANSDERTDTLGTLGTV